MVNRVGDVFILAGIALIFAVVRSRDFGIVFPVADFILTSEE